MVSYKTIKSNDTIIKFNFTNEYVTIQINTNPEYIRYHNEFIESLLQLNLTRLQLKKVRYWYHKNYKKIFPMQEYTTLYGRKIIIPDHP